MLPRPRTPSVLRRHIVSHSIPTFPLCTFARFPYLTIITTFTTSGGVGMARHGSIAEQLDAFREYATRVDYDPEPIQTNWQTVPANVNNPEDIDGLHTERLWEISPSVDEMLRQARNGEPERNEAGQITKWGKLRFSDGTQTEKAERVTIDGGVEQYDCRMPAGALLRAKDKARNMRGGYDNPQEATESRHYFAALFGVRVGRFKPASRPIKVRMRIGHAEAVAMLQDAYSRTDMRRVTFTKCPDALPCGTPNVADNFIGMKKTTCAGGGSTAWQDIVSQRESVEAWRRTLALAADEHLEVLTQAVKARTLRQIGEARGYSGQYAIDAGRRLLVAANDNLQEAMELAGLAKEK